MTWLEKAFGFEPSMVVSDADGRLVHSEMRFGDGYIIVDSEWADHIASPASVAGKNTRAILKAMSGPFPRLSALSHA
ncbi:hypothetical protein NKH84_02825 [Mesorhizobium sp. M0902]|uniref:hypothetical protein n=1 Tax=unclassified Mesorhizobium TaxID=325217 RepID=UPI0033393FB8